MQISGMRYSMIRAILVDLIKLKILDPGCTYVLPANQRECVLREDRCSSQFREFVAP